MENSKHLKRFLDDYQCYASEVLNPTLDEINRLFNKWSNTNFGEYQQGNEHAKPSPLVFTHARIKRPESVVDKILRKSDLFPDGLTIRSVTKMKDAIAGRIVMYFLSGLELVDRAVKNTQELEVSEEYRPVTYLGNNLEAQLADTEINKRDESAGHASILYTVRFRTDYLSEEKRPWFELQVRTITSHLWREVQHVLGYRPYKMTSFAVSTHFQIIESQLNSLDEHFNLLFEELRRFQKRGTYDDKDTLNAENLPAVLTERGIGCTQKEIDGLLKLLTSRGIKTVGKLRDIASGGRIELIRRTYQESEKRNPTNFEIVASLAAIQEIEDDTQAIEAIRTQIEFLRTWLRIKEVIRRKS
ncbi:MAG: RelA/SpoT domain-containing protein [Thermoproteota archaeon]|nr:RelA/SpoT domain-containing protein [Acidobacteriota bacterium]MDQ3903615.1 RelA/SpoT domain-containing protein [Thermoproteota archaeon]